MKRFIFILSLGLAVALIGTAAKARNKKSGNHDVTFSQHIASLFYQHCADCHRPGEAAPFSVLRYEDLRPWAKSIREQVVAREMPPWHADSTVGHWANDRRLSEDQIKQIVAWVDNGAPAGDLSKQPGPPVTESGWRIGKPDLVMTMPKPFTYLPGKSDSIQRFAIPANFKEDVYVKMAEARPGNRRVVHHILVQIVPPGNRVGGFLNGLAGSLLLPFFQSKLIATERDGLTVIKEKAPVFNDGCTLKNGGAGVFKDGSDDLSDAFASADLTAYAPGHNPDIWKPGSYKKIPAGSKVFFEVHYSNVFNNDAPQTDSSSVGLVLVKDPQLLQREMLTGALFNFYFQIPPGAENHTVTACKTLQQDITVTNFMPHMHVRGKSMEYRATFPDGRTETLCKLTAWDFNWQTSYQLKAPPILPKGTKLTLIAAYDNSAKNRFNPDAARAIRWGDATRDEMMLGYFEYYVNGKQ